MWPICFDDLNKLHMSIGIGLLVASYVLLFSTNIDPKPFDNNDYNDFINDVREDIKLYSTLDLSDPQSKKYHNFLNESRTYYIENLRNMTSIQWNIVKSNNQIRSFLYRTGCIFFLIGYIPFMRKQILKK